MTHNDPHSVRFYDTYINNKAITGGPVAIAAHFGLTYQAVNKWRSKGVAPLQVRSLISHIRDFTRGDVVLTVADVRPDYLKQLGE